MELTNKQNKQTNKQHDRYDMNHNVDEIWVPTTFVKKGLVDSGVQECKIVVVPHGVDYEVFSSARDGSHKVTQPVMLM
jgi:glycosyltransferase involved in cell wall biosynthesis